MALNKTCEFLSLAIVIKLVWYEMGPSMLSKIYFCSLNKKNEESLACDNVEDGSVGSLLVHLKVKVTIKIFRV